jgi:hypothetical protein
MIPGKDTGSPKPVVQLTGEDGNAYYIIAKVSRALRKVGLEEEARAFRAEATKGDYDQLLVTVEKYVEVI